MESAEHTLEHWDLFQKYLKLYEETLKEWLDREGARAASFFFGAAFVVAASYARVRGDGIAAAPRLTADRPCARDRGWNRPAGRPAVACARAGCDQADFYKDVQHVQDTTTDPKVQEFVYCPRPASFCESRTVRDLPSWTTRLRGISASRRRRDPVSDDPPSRNIRVAAAAAPRPGLGRPTFAEYPRRGRGVARDPVSDDPPSRNIRVAA